MRCLESNEKALKKERVARLVARSRAVAGQRFQEERGCLIAEGLTELLHAKKSGEKRKDSFLTKKKKF